MVRLVLAGCAVALVMASGARAEIYWANYGANATGTTIGRANLDGSNVNQSFITGAAGPVGIAIDGTHIYWSNSDGPNNTGTRIGRANLNGTGVNQSFISSTAGAHGIALTSTHIYWANRGVDGTGSTIGRANIDGSGVNNNFITGASGPHGIATDGTYIYWANYNNGTIGRANLDGTGVNQSFITGESSPAGITVASGHLYWANAGSNAIGRADLSGCSGSPPCNVTQSFIATASSPSDVAVGSNFIYWTNFGSNGASAGGTTIGCAKLDGTGVDQSFITGANSPGYLAVDSLGPAPVCGAAAVKPHVLRAPVIMVSGSGEPLSCSQGTWGGSPTSFTYRWNRDGAAIQGANGPSYAPSDADAGHALSCTVTAANSVGSAASTSQGLQVPKKVPPPVCKGASVLFGAGNLMMTFALSCQEAQSALQGLGECLPLSSTQLGYSATQYTGPPIGAPTKPYMGQIQDAAINACVISIQFDMEPAPGGASDSTAGAAPAGAGRGVKLPPLRGHIGPGACNVYTLRLSPQARRLLKRNKRVDLKLAITVTDSHGNTTVTHQTVLIKRNGHGAGCPAAPSVRKLAIKPSAFPAAANGGSLTSFPTTGPTVTYTDSRAATTTFTVWRGQPGVIRGGRCFLPAPRHPSPGTRRCTGYLPVVSFTHADRRGANRFHFNGNVGGVKLQPGTYFLVAVPRSGGVTGKSAAVRFRITG